MKKKIGGLFRKIRLIQMNVTVLFFSTMLIAGILYALFKVSIMDSSIEFSELIASITLIPSIITILLEWENRKQDKYISKLNTYLDINKSLSDKFDQHFKKFQIDKEIGYLSAEVENLKDLNKSISEYLDNNAVSSSELKQVTLNYKYIFLKINEIIKINAEDGLIDVQDNNLNNMLSELVSLTCKLQSDSLTDKDRTFPFNGKELKDIIIEDVDFSNFIFKNLNLSNCYFLNCSFKDAKFDYQNNLGNEFMLDNVKFIFADGDDMSDIKLIKDAFDNDMFYVETDDDKKTVIVNTNIKDNQAEVEITVGANHQTKSEGNTDSSNSSKPDYKKITDEVLQLLKKTDNVSKKDREVLLRTSKNYKENDKEWNWMGWTAIDRKDIEDNKSFKYYVFVIREAADNKDNVYIVFDKKSMEELVKQKPLVSGHRYMFYFGKRKDEGENSSTDTNTQEIVDARGDKNKQSIELTGTLMVDYRNEGRSFKNIILICDFKPDSKNEDTNN